MSIPVSNPAAGRPNSASASSAEADSGTAQSRKAPSPVVVSWDLLEQSTFATTHSRRRMDLTIVELLGDRRDLTAKQQASLDAALTRLGGNP